MHIICREEGRGSLLQEVCAPGTRTEAVHDLVSRLEHGFVHIIKAFGGQLDCDMSAVSRKPDLGLGDFCYLDTENREVLVAGAEYGFRAVQHISETGGYCPIVAVLGWSALEYCILRVGIHGIFIMVGDDFLVVRMEKGLF